MDRRPQQLQGQGGYLPSINHVTSGLSACPMHHCSNMFSTRTELDHHIQSVHQRTQDIGMSDLPQDAGSNRSMSMFTPPNSRAPSPMPSERRPSAPGSFHVNCGLERTVLNADKKSKKTEKEKRNRAENAAVLWRTEDVFQIYLGYSVKQQSGGNGNSAGLDATKISILRSMEAVNLYFLDREYRRALGEGSLEQWRAKMHAIVVDGPHGRPFAGTLLDDPEYDACRHSDARAKECLAHGHPDWRECRRSRARSCFQRNERRFVTWIRRGRRQI